MRNARKTVKEVPPRRSEIRYTLEEAFDYCFVPDGLSAAGEPSGDARNNLNTERSIRAVGLLLCTLSRDSNEDISGSIAQGLGEALYKLAGEVGDAAALLDRLSEIERDRLRTAAFSRDTAAS